MDTPIPILSRSHPALATIVGILSAVIAVGAYLVAANFWNFWPYGAPTGIACTMEAKICPDGTAVGRTGPNCEFAACPEKTDTPNTSASPSSTPAESCLPRPACLDSTPRCYPPEPVEGWCLASSNSSLTSLSNPKGGYRIEYPSVWKYRFSGPGFGYASTLNNELLCLGPSPEQACKVSILYSSNASDQGGVNNQLLKSILTIARINPPLETRFRTCQQDVVIGTVNGYEAYTVGNIDCSDTQRRPFRETFIKGYGKVYLIYPEHTFIETPELEQIQDQITSSFTILQTVQ